MPSSIGIKIKYINVYSKRLFTIDSTFIISPYYGTYIM